MLQYLTSIGSILAVKVSVGVSILIEDFWIKNCSGDNHIIVINQEGGFCIDRISIERPVILINHTGIETADTGISLYGGIAIDVEASKHH